MNFKMNIKHYRFLLVIELIFIAIILFGVELFCKDTYDQYGKPKCSLSLYYYILYLGMFLIVSNTIFLFSEIYKEYNYIKIGDYEYYYYEEANAWGTKVKSNLYVGIILSVLSLIIFHNIKLDYAIGGYYFGLSFIIFIILLVIISIIYIVITMIHLGNITKNQRHYADIAGAFLIIIALPLFYVYNVSFKDFMKRNSNEFNIKNEWCNNNFRAIYNDIDVYKNYEKLEGKYKAQVSNRTTIDHRSNLIYTEDEKSHFSLEKIILGVGDTIKLHQSDWNLFKDENGNKWEIDSRKYDNISDIEVLEIDHNHLEYIKFKSSKVKHK